MAVELVNRLAILVACRSFHGMGAAEWRTLVHCILTVMSACKISFVNLLMFPFDSFGGCAARILAMSFYFSSWDFGFLKK
jgi:hypothetical protein